MVMGETLKCFSGSAKLNYWNPTIKQFRSQVWWYLPVISATWEAEIRGLRFKASLSLRDLI
jgi:hypothetical protein